MAAWMPCMAAGIGMVAYWPALPEPVPGAVALGLLMVAVLALAWSQAGCRQLCIDVLALAIGAAWAVGYGHTIRGELLPVALEQQALLLTGSVEGLVERYGGRGQQPTLRWSLRVEQCRRASGADCGAALHRVQLTAYDTALEPRGGERWQLRARLKRPRGFANPGGFDYEAWLVAQRVGAVGYVEAAAANRRLAAAPAMSIDRWRTALKQRIEQRAPHLAHADLLAGLLIGDGSAIAPGSWEVFRATGTVHLFVVSGLQIAFTGGLALWFGRLWWRSPWGRSRRRDYWLGAAPALVVAALYALLAGFGLPIQRALIMFGCVVAALVARREIGAGAWQLALLLVLLGNPLAVLDTGFWFSFVAVAAILIRVGDARHGRRGLWWRVQAALFVTALPLLLAATGQFTLLALPANVLAVPWSTLLTMPPAFAALLLDGIAPRWAGALWWLADLTLQWLWRYLCWLRQWSAWTTWQPAGIQPPGLGCAALFAALYMLPRGTPGRGWAWLFLLPVAWPPLERIAPGDCRLTVIDVGQGLSVLVETAGHRLLYDTGPPFGPQRSVAELAIAPLLRQRGAGALDAVVISHKDSDHAGGWPAIAAQFPVRRLLLGEPLPPALQAPAIAPAQPLSLAGLLQAVFFEAAPSQTGLLPSGPPQPRPVESESCAAGMYWRWDGVEFSVLHPRAGGVAPGGAGGNNRSCVVRIEAGGVAILLPGDIERGVEYALHDQLQPVDILLAPHHGSRSSSTATFVAQLQPRYVIFSTGYRNRFQHPHPSVVERYAQGGARLLNTADSGAVTIDVQGGRVARIERHRDRHRRYWQ